MIPFPLYTDGGRNALIFAAACVTCTLFETLASGQRNMPIFCAAPGL